MLLRFPEEFKSKFRLYQLTYTPEEISALFSGKYKCKECPFVLVWTGKVPEGTTDIHRIYCKMAHVSLRDLPAIIGTTIKDCWKYVEMLKNKSEIAPDTVKIHPHNKKRFILSCLRTKELKSCIIDQYQDNGKSIDEGIIKNIIEWRKKHLR